MYKIESNIPLPPARGRYPFADMKVGDSIFIEGKKTATVAGAAASFVHRTKRDYKFSCRKVNGGTRVWRVR